MMTHDTNNVELKPLSELDLDNPNLLLKSNQLCKWLGISHPTIVRWRIEGIGPPVIKLSKRSFVYRTSDVLSWLDRRTDRQFCINSSQIDGGK